jgi:lipopolysaccharide/colanic/teichoic acid biosynthesis glycosyltransferase
MKAQLIAQHGGDPKFFKLEDDPRITPVGKFIRKTSLDELPNLFNVIRGEMSLVGTRPPTPDEVALYADWHYQRLKTIPGITGLWQVSGRSEVPFDEVVLLDIYYIRKLDDPPRH